MRNLAAACLAVILGTSFAGCSAGTGDGSAVPRLPQLESCVSPPTTSSSGERHALDSSDGLPSNDSTSFYSTTASAQNYDLGASIINFGSKTTVGGGGGPVTDGKCAKTQGESTSPVSATRSTQSFVSYNCLDWYQEATPGIMNAEVDTYLGTTCEEMWVPDNYTATGGYIGGGDIGTTCSAGNADSSKPGCLVAFTPRTCPYGARPLGSPASDLVNKQHSNAISGELEVAVAAPGGGSQLIGWEYQTYGGQEYFQFAFTFSVSVGVVSMTSAAGPIFPFKGGLFGIVQGLARMLGTTQSKLPWPLNTMTPLTPIVKTTC